MKRGDQNPKLGDHIRTRRLSRGLAVSTCARRAHVHQSYWRKLEAGHYRSPHARHLRIIAEVLDCPAADLYALAGYPPTDELPTLQPYLRTKYDLPKEAAAELERYFEYLRSHYGIPPGQTLFPEKPKTQNVTEPDGQDRRRSQRRVP